MTKIIDRSITLHTANLANLSLSETLLEELQKNLAATIDYVSVIQSMDVGGAEETHQITGMTNIFREDTIDEARVLTQEQALSNAPHKHQGYFVVPAVIET